MKKKMLYLITNRKLCKEDKFLEVLKEASESGVDRIIFREKDLSYEEAEALYKDINKVICKNTKLIINSNIDLAIKEDSFGLQLSFKDFINSNIKNRFKGVIGVSVHSIEEAVVSCNKGADYLLLSHIFETKCKEGLKPKGLKFIEEVLKNTTCPIIALGGINLDNAKSVIEKGAFGIAVMSSIMESLEVYEITNRYKEEISQSIL